MLGVNFINPNYEPVYNGKTHYVESLLEIFTTPKALEQLFIYYSGFKYGNATLKLKKATQDNSNDILWKVEDFLRAYTYFKKGQLTDYTFIGKNYAGKDATLHIYLDTKQNYKLTITNELEYEITFSVERFTYLIDRIYLGYLSYLYAHLKLEKLSPNEQQLISNFCLPVSRYFYYAANIIFKYKKGDKPFFLKDDFTANVNSFSIGKLKLSLNGIDSYIPIGLALVLAHDIKSERYFKLFDKGEKQVFVYEGGTLIKDAEPIARKFIVKQGQTKGQLSFILQKGIGKVGKTGGISLMKVEVESCIVLNKNELMCFAKRLEEFYFSFLIEQYLRDEKLPAENQIISQITKVNAKNTLVTTVARAFNMKKIRFDFIKYNSSNHQELYADFYFTEEDFNLLYNNIFSGSLYKSLQAEKSRMEKCNDKWGKAIYSRTCGTIGEAANRHDNCPKAKIFNILPSAISDFAFACYQGKGKLDENGLIIMERIEDRITVPIDTLSLKALMLLTMVSWKAYKVAQTYALERKQLE